MEEEVLRSVLAEPQQQHSGDRYRREELQDPGPVFLAACLPSLEAQQHERENGQSGDEDDADQEHP